MKDFTDYDAMKKWFSQTDVNLNEHILEGNLIPAKPYSPKDTNYSYSHDYCNDLVLEEETVVFPSHTVNILRRLYIDYDRTILDKDTNTYLDKYEANLIYNRLMTAALNSGGS
jgi:hypothetical protein